MDALSLLPQRLRHAAIASLRDGTLLIGAGLLAEATL